MSRLLIALTGIIYASISISLAFSQDDFANQGGIVRGRITDTTKMQNPIAGVKVIILAVDSTEYTTTTDIDGEYKRTGVPPGRYLISIYKEGYGDRLGKPVTVVNSGDHYVSLKMTRKENILTFFKRFGVLFWILLFCGITALLTFLFTKRAITEKYEASQ